MRFDGNTKRVFCHHDVTVKLFFLVQICTLSKVYHSVANVFGSRLRGIDNKFTILISEGALAVI
jgi:hypothetical protein